MSIPTTFLCVLYGAVICSSSPVPHVNYSNNNVQQSNMSAVEYWKEASQLAAPSVGFVHAPLATIPVLFPKNSLGPYYNGNLTRSLSPWQNLVPRTRNKFGRIWGGPHQTVTCRGDDGHPFDGFPCDDNACVPVGWVCDGERDCDGGTDEIGCNDCREDELRCVVRGVSVCLSPQFLCDGKRDCWDGSDEDQDNCQSVCEFRCRDGRGCVPHGLVCDWDRDCLDGSDELYCNNHHVYNDCHPEFEFECYNSLDDEEWSHCIPRAWLCDDHDDCPNGEDEYASRCNRKETYSYWI